jgi:Ca-activated chloride channel homolog
MRFLPVTHSTARTVTLQRSQVGGFFEHPLLSLGLLLILLLLMLVFAAHPVSADGFIIPQPPVDRPIPWRDIPLTVKYHRVTIDIDNQVATTKVDQLFVNDANFAVEGTYIFPLPEDAAVSSFDMWVDGKKLEGKLMNRDEARRIYEDIVRQQKDPALLEYAGRGAFQARIFPIPPHGERRIQLTYTQVLPQQSGLVHYRYPLNTEKFSARPLSEVSISVNLKDRSALRAIYSPSHQVQVVRNGDTAATVGYEATDVRPDRDFDLYYSLSTDQIAVNLLSYKTSDEDGYFLLLVTPPIEAQGEQVAKDVVLVLDTSGSMDGEKIIQAKGAAKYVLDNLGDRDRFNIVAFSTATRLFSDKPASVAQRAAGKDFVDKLQAAGSTDINRALLEAIAGADPTRPTVVIFLTDGLPTAGETDPDQIIANVGASAPKSVRLFSFGVGYDVDTVLLDELSSKQRGTSAYVAPDQDIKEEVSGFYEKVSTPVLVDVQAAFSGVTVDDMYPYPLPDLFAGSQLVVAGRYRAGGAAGLSLTGTVNGQPRTNRYAGLAFVDRGGSEFIPRLWAQRKIGYLLTQIRLKGASAELVAEVTALATKWGIATPYTSFLVEEPGLGAVQPWATPAPFPRGGLGGGPAAGAPTAAPAAVAPDAGGARSGAAAVAKSQSEAQMQQSDTAPAAPAGATIRQVGDKTFVLQKGVWVDTAFDARKMTPESIKFASDRYFKLLTDQPAIARYLALGDKVTVVLQGKAYAVAP